MPYCPRSQISHALRPTHFKHDSVSVLIIAWIALPLKFIHGHDSREPRTETTALVPSTDSTETINTAPNNVISSSCFKKKGPKTLLDVCAHPQSADGLTHREPTCPREAAKAPALFPKVSRCLLRVYSASGSSVWRPLPAAHYI